MKRQRFDFIVNCKGEIAAMTRRTRLAGSSIGSDEIYGTHSSVDFPSLHAVAIAALVAEGVLSGRDSVESKLVISKSRRLPSESPDHGMARFRASAGELFAFCGPNIRTPIFRFWEVLETLNRT